MRHVNDRKIWFEDRLGKFLPGRASSLPHVPSITCPHNTRPVLVHTTQHNTAHTTHLWIKYDQSKHLPNNTHITMNLRLRSPSLNLAVIALLAMGQVVKCQESYPVPTFTLDELQRGTRDKSLKRTLTSNGLLAIRVPSNDQHQDLLSGLCRCRDNREIHGGDKILLADGLTTRSTIATATMGTDRPLPLPEDDITKQCGAGTYQSLERARDYVSQAASDAFMPALDRLIESSSSEGMASNEALLTKKNGYGYSSISAIVEEAVNLEHFHSYSKKNDGASDEEAPVDDALDWHTDGGLFIAFLPAKSCNDDGKDDDSFRLKMHGSSTEVKAVFPQTQEGEVIVAIMLGAGAEHWLHTPDSLQLRATRHAVKMSSGDERVWYGMMHLVPAAAIVQTVPKVLTFAEFKETATHSAGRRFGDDKSHPDNIVVGCGVHDDSHSLLSSNNYSAPRRRRLQHVGKSNELHGYVLHGLMFRTKPTHPRRLASIYRWT